MKEEKTLRRIKDCSKHRQLANFESNQKVRLSLGSFIGALLIFTGSAFATVYQFLGNHQQVMFKTYLALGMVFLVLLFTPLIIYQLKVSLKKVLASFFILDLVFLTSCVSAFAFISLMKYLDRGMWEMKVIQIAYLCCLMSVCSILRLLLLYMHWVPWKVIVFKIAIYVQSLTYLGIVTYALMTNFSVSNNFALQIDKTVRQFMIMFLMAQFEFCCCCSRLFTEFDYTDKLKCVYIIKDSSKKIQAIKKQIIGTRRTFKKIMTICHLNLQNEVHMIPVTKIQPKELSINDQISQN